MLTQSRLNTTTGIILLFEQALPILDPAEISSLLQSIEPINSEVCITTDRRSDGSFYAAVAWENHRLHLIGSNTPVPPQTLQHTVQVSHWDEADKAQLCCHKTHLRCVYEGIHPDMTERLIALYKVAYSLHRQNLIGVLDEEAWTCMPIEFLVEQMSIAHLKTYRQTVPTGIWTSFVTFFDSPTEVWFCSKGHHRFGAKDFAYRGRIEQASATYELFNQLFDYTRQSSAALEVGDTAEISGDRFLKFSRPSIHQPYLNSPLGTIVLEDICASQINRVPVVYCTQNPRRFCSIENN